MIKLIFTLPVLFLPVSLSSETFWCPESCHCSIPARIIDCSSLHFTRIPLVPKTTVRLYLSNNKLKRISSSEFHNLHQLTYLILSNNQIEDISNDAFRGLTSLKYLILDGNRIKELPIGVLNGLHHLSTFSIARNRLTFLPSGFLDHSKSLSLLNFQYNDLSDVEPNVFKQLIELKSLNLQENNLGNNIITEISTCQNLSVLRLDSNLITSFIPSNNFPSLQSLHMTSNQISSLSMPILPNCSNLHTLDLSNNSITELNINHFSGCHNLQKIYLPHNNISTLNNSLANLKLLKNVYLHHNQIKNIPSSVFLNSTSIQRLYLHGNNITTLPVGVLRSLPNLTHIYLDPVSCKCNILPLAVWAHRHRLKGLRCWIARKGVVALTSLLRTCKDKNLKKAMSNPVHELDADSNNCKTDDFFTIFLQTSFQKQHHHEKNKQENITKSNKSEDSENDKLKAEIDVLSETVNSLQQELLLVHKKLARLEAFLEDTKEYQIQSGLSLTVESQHTCCTKTCNDVL